ncbi:MAG: S41 family peptidase [Eubacteriales bacterium]|nr:S41 family peptidase [Eubacteriales bacterium]
MKEKKHTWKFFIGLLAGVVLTLFGMLLIEGRFTVAIPFLGEAVVTLPTYGIFHDKGNKIDMDMVSAKVGVIENFLDTEYYYTPDKKELEEGIYEGIIGALNKQDIYAEYMTIDDFKEEVGDMKGTYVGIGVTVTTDPKTKGVLIVTVNANGPSKDAGLRNGDVILEADGVDLTVLDLSESVAEHIKGEPGTIVNIKVLRDGEILEYAIERKELDNITTYASVLEENGKKYGYMYISNFQQSTIHGFTEGIDSFEKEKVDGIIFDLRSNPGGDMNIAINMVDYIIDDKDLRFGGDKALLLSIEQKVNPTTYYRCVDGHSVKTPIVTIVNEGSASAAEIFTGVLRSYGYKSAGMTTYGKGIVQTVRMLYDKSGIKYTSGEYVLPDGSKIHKVGIVPDTEIDATEEMYEKGISVEEPDPTIDVQLKAAIKLLEGDR